MSAALHVVDSVYSRRALKVALHTVDPRAQVVALLDPLDVGPIADIDDRAIARRKFSKQVGFVHDDWLRIRRADARLCKLLRDGPREIVIWRGLTARELLLSYRFAARFARLGCPVFEVVNERCALGMPPFLSMIGVRKPKELVALAPQRAPIHDLDARAARWEALKRGGSFFRALRDKSEIIELGDDAYDELILTSCESNWKSMNYAISGVMMEAMLGDWVVAWRIRTLIARGLLEGQGSGPFGPKEVRRREA
jgi:hypothetical protein